MHELGLLTSVIETISRLAAENHAHDVSEVTLKVGTRSGAIPAALEGAWEFARPGTVCASARLVLHEVPATVWCPTCERDVEIDEFFALLCPECGTPTANLTHGKEFEIETVTWETD